LHYLLCYTGIFLILLHYYFLHTPVWTLDFIAYYHLVFVMIIPTHIVYCICITLFFILPNSKRDALVSLHGDGVRYGISACCTTPGIEPIISFPTFQSRKLYKLISGNFHFQYSKFLSKFNPYEIYQNNARTSSIVVLLFPW